MRDCGDQQPRLPALGASPPPSPHSGTPRSPDACRDHRCPCHPLDPCRIYGGEDVEGWALARDAWGHLGDCPTSAWLGYDAPIPVAFLWWSPDCSIPPPASLYRL